MLGKIEGSKRRGQQSMRSLDGITDSSLSKLQELVMDRVENSEGAHNSELSMHCLDTADARIDEAMALLEKQTT